MEAMMGSSSSSPCLKLVLCRDKSSGFVCFKDEFFAKSQLKSPLHQSRSNHKNRVFDFKLSVSVSSSRRGLRPGSQSSSHTQAEVDNHELLIEESPNGHTIEAKAQTVRVQFQLQRECSFGQNFLITGDDPIFGLWDPNNAIPLTWSEGHLWTVDLDIPIGKCIKFKFIMQESNGEFVWQPGPDRILECFKTEKVITLCEDWENPDSRRVIETDRTFNQEIQTVAAIEEMPVEPSVTQEPIGYVVNMKEVLVSDEGVPVLVPGLSQLAVNEAPNNEPEVMNGAAVVSTGPDMAMDLKLPELDSKGDSANTSNSNPRLEIASIHENQDPCEIKHQEMQRVADKQYHQAPQPTESLLVNDIQWGSNVMQKLLNIFRIQ